MFEKVERIAVALEKARQTLTAGTFIDAVSLAEQALSLDPDSSDARSVLCESLLKTKDERLKEGDYEGTLKALIRYCQLRPDDAQQQQEVGRLQQRAAGRRAAEVMAQRQRRLFAGKLAVAAVCGLALAVIAFDGYRYWAASHKEVPLERVAALQGYQQQALLFGGLAGKRIDEAQKDLDEQTWQAACAPGAPSEWSSRLESYIHGSTLRRHEPDAQTLLAQQSHELAWLKASAAGRPEELLMRLVDYLATCGNDSPHRSEAEKQKAQQIQLIDDQAWLAAKSGEPAQQIDGIAKYLAGPTSKTHRQEAEALADKLNDDRAWSKANKPGEPEEWIQRLNSYLADGAKKFHVDEANTLRAEQSKVLDKNMVAADDAAWNAASKPGEAAQQLERLAAYLVGTTIKAHRSEAEALAARIHDEQSWTLAEKPGDAAEWKQRLDVYLAYSPNTLHRDEAAALRAKLVKTVDDATWETAKQQVEPEEWLKRLTAYLDNPDNTAHRAEAEAMRAQQRTAIDERAWAVASKPGEPDEWLARLTSYLAGTTLKAHRAEAEDLQKQQRQKLALSKASPVDNGQANAIGEQDLLGVWRRGESVSWTFKDGGKLLVTSDKDRAKGSWVFNKDRCSVSVTHSDATMVFDVVRTPDGLRLQNGHRGGKAIPQTFIKASTNADDDGDAPKNNSRKSADDAIRAVRDVLNR